MGIEGGVWRNDLDTQCIAAGAVEWLWILEIGGRCITLKLLCVCKSIPALGYLDTSHEKEIA
jgi:hypothetical protein